MLKDTFGSLDYFKTKYVEDTTSQKKTFLKLLINFYKHLQGQRNTFQSTVSFNKHIPIHIEVFLWDTFILLS